MKSLDNFPFHLLEQTKSMRTRLRSAEQQCFILQYPLNLFLQSVLACKQLMRRHNLADLHETNRAETAVLVERWTSEDCHQAILKFFMSKAKLWSIIRSKISTSCQSEADFRHLCRQLACPGQHPEIQKLALSSCFEFWSFKYMYKYSMLFDSPR